MSQTSDQARTTGALQARLEEAEETLRAIRSGEVDALVVNTTHGEQIFTLQGADRPYRIMVEQMHEGAATLSEAGLVLYANRRLAELLKTPLQRLIGVPASSFIEPEQIPHLQTLLFESRQAARHAEMTLRAADGTSVATYVAAGPLDLDAEAAVCLVVTDLSDIRQAEAALADAHAGLRRYAGELERVNAHLARSEESFRAAFEQSPIGTIVVVLDEQGPRRIARVNAAMSDILALPREDLLGRDPTEFTHPQDDSDARTTAAQMAGAELPRYDGRRRIRRANGETAWIEFRSSMVHFPDISGVTVLSHVIDITERHHLEAFRAQQAAIVTLVSQVTTGVLAAQPLSTTYQQIVDGVARIFGAEQVALGFSDPATAKVAIAATVGVSASRLRDRNLPLDHRLVQWLVGHAEADSPEPPTDLHPGATALGPGCTTRFGTGEERAGLLAMTRPRGDPPFTPTDVGLLNELSRQLSLAVELGRARTDQQRLAVLEDRQRVARDLHDTVIQDLIAIGMQLTHRTRERDTHTADRITAITDQLEDTVRRLRGIVFELNGPTNINDLSRTIHAIATEAARAIGHHPAVTLDGPVDDLPAHLRDPLIAVLRESLSNVARHAHATSAHITLVVDQRRIALTVEDDGVGLPPAATTGYGLANITHRAQELGGRANVTRRQPSGTRIEWTVPWTPPSATTSPRTTQPSP
jgi:PAS domain S-box-containing protein